MPKITKKTFTGASYAKHKIYSSAIRINCFSSFFVSTFIQDSIFNYYYIGLSINYKHESIIINNIE